MSVKKKELIKITSGSSLIVILLYNTAFETSSDFSRFKKAPDFVSCLKKIRNCLHKLFKLNFKAKVFILKPF